MINALKSVLPLLLLGGAVIAQELKTVELPKPDTTGGAPLMQALKHRQSAREFRPDSLPLPVLSNLLWAACGINRLEGGKRTAPSAMNWQEIQVYVATSHALYLYDETPHALKPILAEDVRAKTGMQPFVADAPVNLIYVADYAKISKGSDSDKILYTAADAGFISQNVYLFCASEHLATVVRGSVDRAALAKTMKLRSEQKIVLVQTVGYPK